MLTTPTKLTSQSNRGEKGIYIEVANDAWASGYVFRDIIIDAYVKKPLTVESPNYNSCINFAFDTIQIQNKHNSIGFKHDYLARFSGVQDLYLTNCKVWDFSYEYTTENVIYNNCTNVVVRNSPVFEKFYSDKNPFTIEGGTIGFKENQKLYNTDYSQNNGYVGMSGVVNVEGEANQAIPYLIPHNFSHVMYSKLVLDLWTRVNYGSNCGDTMTHVEMVQTNYVNNMVYMHNAVSMPIIKKMKKYKEGLVVWLKGNIGDVNVSYVAGGKITPLTATTLNLWDGTNEMVTVEPWSDDEVIPVCKSLTIISGSSITSETVV